MHIRNNVTTVIAGMMMCAVSSSAFAAAATPSYPTKPVRLIVAFPPGGSTDIIARLVGQRLGDKLGQQVIVDNRGGAGGTIGTEIAARATPDGYTLTMGTTSTHVIAPAAYAKVNYDPVKDFEPITLVASTPYLLVLHPGVKATNVKEFVALAKSQPGKLNYASAGNGVANHLAGELFKQMTGTDIVHVPYKGAPQAVTDVVGGHMNMMFNSISPIIGHIQAGRVRVLGIASLQRSPQLPDLPTISESGVPGFEAVNWFGMFAPAKTPKAIINRVNAALVSTVKSPDINAQFIKLGADPVGSSVEEFTAFVRRDMEKYAKIVKISGAKID